tara:strand:+ start:611 stop:877 length:267 start_codon:yes stop_codon:yes gene_type:complete
MSKIITDQQIDLASEAEPAEVLFAVHRRIVAAEKAFVNLKNVVSDFSVELEMLKERIKKLENNIVDSKEDVGTPYSSVYGEDEQEESK